MVPSTPPPSQMSTMPTEGASFSIALASSTVRLGRRINSEKLAPPAIFTRLTLLRMIVFGPSWRMLSRSDSSNPRISDVIPTIAVMPMTTPRMVSPERILFVRSVSNAIQTTSRSNPLFTAQGLDWIERRRARCRIRAEEQADAGGDADAEHDRPRLEAGGQRCQRRYAGRGQETERDADHAAKRREGDRLSQHLRHDVLALRS